jgi:hypothetical protein
LTGSPAYDKDTEVSLMYAHLLEPPPSAREKRPELPAEVDQVLQKAMAKSKDDRYADAREFATAVRGALGGGASATVAPPASPAAQETVLAATPPGVAPTVTDRAVPAPPAADPGPPAEPGARKPRSRLLLAGLGAAALVAVAAVLAIVLAGGGDDDPAAAPAGGDTATETVGGAADPTATGADTTEAPTPTEPAAPSSLLEVLVPSQIAASCTPSTTPREGAVETNTCVPTEGAPTSSPNEVELSFFPDAESLERAYAGVREGAEPTSCGGTVGERVWIHPATGQRGGRRVCQVDGSGEFVIVWTHEKLGAADHVNMLGVAREPGRSPTTFQSWWAAVNDNLGKCRPKVSEETCSESIQSFTQ